jgi:hypothetical protein
LLGAISSSDDPVALLQAAGQDHIPVNPSARVSSVAFSSANTSTAVPAWEDRPPIDDVIADILEQDWYQNQIVDRRTCDAKPGQFGRWEVFDYAIAYNHFCHQPSSTHHFRPQSRKRYEIQERLRHCTHIK